MRSGARIQSLLDEFARRQGLQRLDFDDDGLVPVRLDGRTDIAIGHSPANDSVFLFGVLDERPDTGRLDLWALFTRNAALSPRRTRLALQAGALVLTADAPLEGLTIAGFTAMLDRFVADFEAESAAYGARPAIEPVGARGESAAAISGLPSGEGPIIWG